MGLPRFMCRLAVQTWLIMTIPILPVQTPGGQDHAQAAAQPERPNIVVIMTDDLDVGSLNVMLTHGLMPHLQAHVIDQGTTFRESFVSIALCCPSRATFLTGQYPHNHGVHTNASIRDFNDRSTLATWLQGVGYRTGHVGKYLNGYGQVVSPTYIPPGYDSWQALVNPSTYQVYDYTLNDNGYLITYGSAPSDYQTDVLAQRAKAFIAQSAQADVRPFFLVVTPLAPHHELGYQNCDSEWGRTIRPAPRHQGTLPAFILLPQLPSFNEADVSDKLKLLQKHPLLLPDDVWCLGKQYQERLESLRAVDDLVGTVVDALEGADALESTVLIFTSDNGWFYGEHRLTEKLWPYEEAIRVPLYIRAPGPRGGQIATQMVLNNDLAPTIAELARATPGLTMDGRSLLPLLKGSTLHDGRKRFLLAAWGYGARDAPFWPFFAVRTSSADRGTPDRIYVEYAVQSGGGPRTVPEFYDLTMDPYQLQNLSRESSRRQEIVILRRWLTKLKTCVGVQCRILEDR